MEGTNLIALISRLMKFNNPMTELGKNETPRDGASIIKEYLDYSEKTKRGSVLSLSKQLALEQLRFLN